MKDTLSTEQQFSITEKRALTITRKWLKLMVYRHDIILFAYWSIFRIANIPMPVEIVSNFIAENCESSVRLFFLRANALDKTWHISDAALGTQKDPSGRIIHYLTLHGSWLPAYDKADTLLQCKLLSDENAVFCMRCLDEFDIAKDTIEGRRLLKFH